jgi:hypothetical protein
VPTILNCFLENGEVSGVHSLFATDQPGIAVLPGFWSKKKNNNNK